MVVHIHRQRAQHADGALLVRGAAAAQVLRQLLQRLCIGSSQTLKTRIVSVRRGMLLVTCVMWAWRADRPLMILHWLVGM